MKIYGPKLKIHVWNGAEALSVIFTLWVTLTDANQKLKCWSMKMQLFWAGASKDPTHILPSQDA